MLGPPRVIIKEHQTLCSLARCFQTSLQNPRSTHDSVVKNDHLGMNPPDVNHQPQVSFNWFNIWYAPVWDDAKWPQHDWLMGWSICFDDLAIRYGNKNNNFLYLIGKS